MNKDKKQYAESGVGHGLGGKRIGDDPRGNGVSGSPDLVVLIEEHQTQTDMDKENQKDAETEDQDNQGMTVQFIGIALKNRPAHIDGRISCRMAAEKQQQHQP
jgi:hypothetical protein